MYLQSLPRGTRVCRLIGKPRRTLKHLAIAPLPLGGDSGCSRHHSSCCSPAIRTRTHLINARRSRRRQDLLNEILETPPNHQFPAVADTETLWLLGHKTIYEITSSLGRGVHGWLGLGRGEVLLCPFGLGLYRPKLGFQGLLQST